MPTARAALRSYAGMRLYVFVALAIVLANEERVQGDETGLNVRSSVAGGKKLLSGSTEGIIVGKTHCVVLEKI